MATDFEGRTATKNYQIALNENSWSTDEKSAGSTNYSHVDAPSTDNVTWTSSFIQGFTGEKLPGSKAIVLKYGSRIIVARNIRIAGLDAASVTYMFIFNTFATDFIVKMEASCGTIPVLDALYGTTKWTRGGITSFAVTGNTLYAESGGDSLVIDIASGNLLSTLDAALGSSDWTVLFHGSLYRPDAGALSRLGDTGWNTAKTLGESPITDIAADENGFAVITAGGTLVTLDSRMNMLNQTGTPVTNGSLALGDRRIVAYGGGIIRIMDRTTLAATASISNMPSYVAGSKEKLFAITDSRIMALGVYAGTLMRDAEGTFDDIALAEERLFALGTAGTVTCFESPEN
jgi:hypothetical protein